MGQEQQKSKVPQPGLETLWEVGRGGRRNERGRKRKKKNKSPNFSPSELHGQVLQNRASPSEAFCPRTPRVTFGCALLTHSNRDSLQGAKRWKSVAEDEGLSHSQGSSVGFPLWEDSFMPCADTITLRQSAQLDEVATGLCWSPGMYDNAAWWE